MILPEDVKAPIVEGDGEENDIHDQYHIHNQHYLLQPYSPTSHDLYLPLLHASDGDLEHGPAPPYAANDPSQGFPVRRFESSKKASRLSKYRRAAFWMCTGMAATIMTILFIDWRRPHHRHGKPWMDASTSDDFDLQWDGESVQCARFNPDDWSSFPISPDQPHLPLPIEGEGQRVSKNVTFWLPTQNHEDLFTRLAGTAPIGDFFVDILDSSDSTADEDSSDIGDRREGSSGGESVKITVEPIISLVDGEEIEQSVGWRMLHASDICSMERHGGDHTFKRHLQPPSPVQRGVGIYTHRIDDPPRHHRYTPLQFRVHVGIPAGLYPSVEPARGFFDSLRGPPVDIPKGFIRSLSIDGGVGGVWISNLTQAAIGELAAELEVGKIQLGSVRADGIRLKVQTGEISGYTTVSRSLDADIPSGDIELGVGIARPAPFAPPFPAAFVSAEGVLSPSAVAVTARTGSGSIRLRYVDWEDESRLLAQDVHSDVGSVEILSHPLFQGPLSLSSDLGSIHVNVPSEPIEDPTGQGRVRDIKLEHHDRLGHTSCTGQVAWRRPANETNAAVSDNVYARSSGRPHGGPAGPERDVKVGLNVRTTVGAINVSL